MLWLTFHAESSSFPVPRYEDIRIPRALDAHALQIDIVKNIDIDINLTNRPEKWPERCSFTLAPSNQVGIKKFMDWCKLATVGWRRNPY